MTDRIQSTKPPGNSVPATIPVETKGTGGGSFGIVDLLLLPFTFALSIISSLGSLFCCSGGGGPDPEAQPLAGRTSETSPVDFDALQDETILLNRTLNGDNSKIIIETFETEITHADSFDDVTSIGKGIKDSNCLTRAEKKKLQDKVNVASIVIQLNSHIDKATEKTLLGIAKLLNNNRTQIGETAFNDLSSKIAAKKTQFEGKIVAERAHQVERGKLASRSQTWTSFFDLIGRHPKDLGAVITTWVESVKAFEEQHVKLNEIASTTLFSELCGVLNLLEQPNNTALVKDVLPKVEELLNCNCELSKKIKTLEPRINALKQATPAQPAQVPAQPAVPVSNLENTSWEEVFDIILRNKLVASPASHFFGQAKSTLSDTIVNAFRKVKNNKELSNLIGKLVELNIIRKQGNTLIVDSTEFELIQNGIEECKKNNVPNASSYSIEKASIFGTTPPPSSSPVFVPADQVYSSILARNSPSPGSSPS
jgi:hypothetical protein